MHCTNVNNNIVIVIRNEGFYKALPVDQILKTMYIFEVEKKLDIKFEIE